jgi:hypothetical protein
LSASIARMGVQSKVPVHIVPRLLMGTLDGLAMHDYFDPLDPADDLQMENVLETIGFFLFEI